MRNLAIAGFPPITRVEAWIYKGKRSLGPQVLHFTVHSTKLRDIYTLVPNSVALQRGDVSLYQQHAYF